ncbi:MAG: lipoyl(octanoyl) transferase LipB [Oligoflexia bacterium]|nr:lipoyl(octanoyl) transferase LipB [Oligoflexia bacterium]
MLIKDLGLKDYLQVLKIQHEHVEKRLEAILVCEHPKVITLGRAKEAATDVILNNIQVVEVERGGRATLHLPGQVVVYPIIDVLKRGLDANKILRHLESAIIKTLLDFRINSQAVEGKTGVWVGDNFDKKIASIGIAIKNNMSFHGLSLNVSCDLKEFKNIKPCGFESSVMTTMLDMLTSEYKKTWKLTPETLIKRVKLRLTENIIEDFLIE